MPQAIPVIAGWAVSAWAVPAGAAATYGTIGAALLRGAVMFAASYSVTKVMGLDDAVKPPAPARGVRQNVRGTDAAVPIIYGTMMTGGVIAQVVTSGGTVRVETSPDGTDAPVTNNKYLNFALVWSEGEIAGVNEIWFNDSLIIRVPYPGTVASYETSGHRDEDGARLYLLNHHLGTESQSADADFLDTVETTFSEEFRTRVWTSSATLSGLAYSYIRLRYSQKWFAQGIPNVSAKIHGKLLYDFRDETTKKSANSALVIYDYLTNTRYGVGIDVADIDVASFASAANYCDELVNVYVPEFDSYAQFARYETNMSINTDSPLIENIKLMLASCFGTLVFSGGKYKLIIDRPTSVSFDITDDNIVGSWRIDLENSGSRFNEVSASYSNEAIKYQNDRVTASSATYLAADAGHVLRADVDLPGVTYDRRALMMAWQILRQSRYSISCELTVDISCIGIEVGDVVSVTHAVPGWDAQQFRVIEVRLAGDDSIALRLRQYSSAVYDIDDQGGMNSPVPTTLNNSLVVDRPWVVPADDSIWSGYEMYPPDYTPDVWALVGVRPASDSGTDWAYQVQWRQSSDDEWQEKTIVRPTLQEFIPPGGLPVFNGVHVRIQGLRPGVGVFVRARALSPIGVESDWYEWLHPVTVGGDMTVPPYINSTDVRATRHPNGVMLRWNRTDERPYVKTEVRRMTFAEYSAAAPFVDPDTGTLVGYFSGNSYLDILPVSVSADTIYVYWFRHVSSFGVEGPWPTVTTVGYSGLGTYDDDAAAGAAGLIAGDMYKHATGEVIVKL